MSTNCNLVKAIKVTVTLKKSQWFGKYWIFYFNDKLMYCDTNIVVFYYEGSPEHVLQNVSASLNHHQIETLKIDF